MAKAPILDLSTLIDRPAIRIDGKTYHLKSAEELSLMETVQFGAWGKELEELASGPSADPKLRELVVRAVAQAALADVPLDVFDKLSTSQMMSIVEVFTALLLDHRLKVAGAIAHQVTRSIGANFSPGSSAASAATPATGSIAPQPGS